MGNNPSYGDIWVAEGPNGNIVGGYSKIRYAMWCFGAGQVGSQGVDLVTHPDFRGQGIASALLEHSFEDSQLHGIILPFAFPNAESYHLQLRMGSIEYDILRTLDYILDVDSYVKWRYPNGGLPKLVGRIKVRGAKFHETGNQDMGLARDEGLAADFGVVWESLTNLVDVGIIRSNQYLKWRYDQRWGDYKIISATKENATAGYAVVRERTKEGMKSLRICEILASQDKEEVYDFLIRQVLSMADLTNSGFVSVSSSLTSGAVRALGKGGFRSHGGLPRGLKQNRNGTLIINPPGVEMRNKLENSTWYRSLGDMDAG